MRQTSDTQSEDGYAIRAYQPGDADRFRSLYESVWGTTKSAEWFDWRFAANPHADGIEMIVAEDDGLLVGAEPVIPYRLRAGERLLSAWQPVDWIVHPEYRREGIFSAMTEALLDTVRGDTDLLYNFPNEQLLPGIQQFDWQVIDTVATRYRVQDPATAAGLRDAHMAESASSRLAIAASPLLQAGLGLCDRFVATHDDITVQRVQGLPLEIVSERYEASVPSQLHVPRDRRFLEWRFANPRWHITTYVARRDGDVGATVVAATERIGGSKLVRLLDVQPMTEAEGDADAFEAILQAVVSDNRDASVLKAPTGPFPGVLRRCGFLRDDSFPFSRFSATTFHAVRPLEGGSVVAAAEDDGSVASDPDALDPRNADDWLLALGDLDVA